MPVSEKRAIFLQNLENRIREKTGAQNTVPSPAARTLPYSEAGKIKNIITSPPSSDSKLEEVFACLNRLEERIDLLDSRMKRHFGNSKLVESEISRLVADRWESLSKETDECLTRMMGEMQDLRDIVIGLRSTVRGMEKQA